MNFPTKFLLALIVPLVVSAAQYDVGPGQYYSELGEVDWLNLQGGDTVRIHYRETPYREKIGLHGRGSEADPIRIVGVKGENGELPVVSGENAVTDEQFDGFFSSQWDENLGVFIIKRASTDAWGYKPGYITIENLKITGAHPNYSYADMAGATANYSNGAAAVWAVLAEHLVIRGCEIVDNANGLFVLSKNNSEEETSRDILFETNYIHENGVAGSDRQHNIYTQAAGMVFQYNRIGTLRSAALGSSLKDRSSGTVIRYNWVEASARALDLVDPEDSYAILTHEADFNRTFVYGNVILNDNVEKAATDRTVCSRLIHYGGDSGNEEIYRKGTLYFFHNTVVVKSTQNLTWRHRFFDLSTNDERIELWNNVLFVDGGVPEIDLLNVSGVADCNGTNWINAGYHNGYVGQFDGTVNINGTLIEGTDPLFVAMARDDYRLSLDSECIESASSLSEFIGTNHNVSHEYRLHQSWRPRSDCDAQTCDTEGIALGAFGYLKTDMVPLLYQLLF